MSSWGSMRNFVFCTHSAPVELTPASAAGHWINPRSFFCSEILVTVSLDTMLPVYPAILVFHKLKLRLWWGKLMKFWANSQIPPKTKKWSNSCWVSSFLVLNSDSKKTNVDMVDPMKASKKLKNAFSPADIRENRSKLPILGQLQVWPMQCSLRCAPTLQNWCLSFAWLHDSIRKVASMPKN